jgi:hypothetical protein
MRVACRFRTDRENDFLGGDFALGMVVQRGETQGMRIFERGSALDDVDAVSLKLMPGDVDLVFDHLVRAEQQVTHRDVVFNRIGRAVDAAFAVAGEMKHRFAQGLTGNGARIDADAADHCAVFRYRCSLSQLGRLNCGALTRRAGTEN